MPQFECPKCGGGHEPGICPQEITESKEEGALGPKEQAKQRRVQKKLEASLSADKIFEVRDIISLAERKNIPLDFSKPAIVSALQKFLDSSNDIGRLKEVVDLAENKNIPLKVTKAIKRLLQIGRADDTETKKSFGLPEIEKRDTLEVQIDSGIDREFLEAYFGGADKEKIAQHVEGLIPKEINNLVRQVFIKKKKADERVWSDGRRISASGSYDIHQGTISLYVENGGHLETVLWHEFGHAVMFGEGIEKEAGELHRKFFDAVRQQSTNFLSTYAMDTYREEGAAIGLHEDFAETFNFFFTDPELLKEKNPERFQAMSQIINELFPSLDVEGARMATKQRERERQAREKQSPKICRTFFEEVSNNAALAEGVKLFPTFDFRFLDFLQSRGSPKSIVQRRTEAGIGITISAHYGEDGELREEIIEEGGRRTEVFFEPKYDKRRNTLRSYKTTDSWTGEVLLVQLSYRDNESLPSEIEIIKPETGKRVGVVTYQQSKGKLIERFVLEGGGESKSVYKFDKSKKISSVRGMIKNQVILERTYEYDRKGRLSSKNLLNHLGRSLKKINYKYD